MMPRAPLGALGTEPSIKIAIYRVCRLVEIVEGPPADAWRRAVASVRARDAFGRRTGSSGGWYRTANRNGYQRGSYRATPISAGRLFAASYRKEYP